MEGFYARSFHGKRRKVPMKKTGLLMVAAIGLALVFSVSDGSAQTRDDTSTASSIAPFGLAGIAREQTARLNVINLHPPEPGLPSSPCAVALSFLDENGETFQDRDGIPVATSAALLPGQSAFLELSSADAFGESTALRKQFRALVERSPGPPDVPPNPFCSGIVSTLEVYDNLTGRTTVLYYPPNPFMRNPGPPNDPVAQ
jgi:hypothetical protein